MNNFQIRIGYKRSFTGAIAENTKSARLFHQIWEQAINATGSMDDVKLSDYCRNNEFETVMGTIRFGDNGEWYEPRMVQVQFQNIKDKNIETFKDSLLQVVVSPASYASGKLYPYSEVPQ